MIHNPYPTPTDENDKVACRFQTYLSGEDKGLLSAIRPIRGTTQAVVNHLIKNLCDDLRELGITSYRPDADDIFTILVERRDLTEGQLDRLRRTTLGTPKQIPTGLREYSRGSSVRQRSTNAPSGPDHATKQVVRRVKQDRKNKTSKGKKSAN